MKLASAGALKLERIPQLSPCDPPLWARGGHKQTILAHLIPSPVLTEKGERLEIKLRGGDVGIAHLFRAKRDPSRVVYLFHGLGGYSHGPYMQRTALLALARGWSVIMYNHRGCGEGEGLAREPYHSGRSEDLSSVVEEGRKLFPAATHLAIGFSLSGNALLLLAAGQRAEVLPDGAISVNAPIDLARGARMLGRGLNRIYDVRFMSDMRRSIRSRIDAGHEVHQMNVPWHATIEDFDELYTAPASGFRDRADYYATCSAKRYLKDIKIPTVMLTASDDPFVLVEDYENAVVSPLVHVHIEKFGGHMGFLSRGDGMTKTKRWLDYALGEYMDAFVREKD